MKIFIADGSSIFRKMLVHSLAEIQGVSVVDTSETALGAIESIGKFRPDVVIVDIRLKEGSGIDVLQAMKKPGNMSTIVIVLTNFPYAQYRQISMSYGADYFFHKATQFNDVVTVLKSLQSAHRFRYREEVESGITVDW